MTNPQVLAIFLTSTMYESSFQNGYIIHLISSSHPYLVLQGASTRSNAQSPFDLWKKLNSDLGQKDTSTS